MSKQCSAELWIKLTLPGVGQIGPGKIGLLRRIAEQRSIAAAARSMNMSYRRAWMLVDELNQMFEQPVVETYVGGNVRGGATVTALGQRLIQSYDAIVAASRRASVELLDALPSTRPPEPSKRSRRSRG